MPSRRELIQMRPEEIRQYLEGQRRIIVVTNGPDGMPHPVPMNYGLDAEGCIIVTAFRKSQKIVNLERDPRASLLVESGETYHELKSVIVYAHAQILCDPDTVMEKMRLIRSSESLTIAEGTDAQAQVRASMAKRAIVLFTPYKYVSWDHAKLGLRY
ncbi:MAG TPA: pyridoxamine 5'-phosphate oxidase family protein [Sphingobium sp.]|uniref:pyridoxamine 5'-phosphate oxidase family protein n=1 Tax=Sphingobium sp. TaxID=1912891 RepID=UPI002ED5032F